MSSAVKRMTAVLYWVYVETVVVGYARMYAVR